MTEPGRKPSLVIVTGHSGSGKSVALNTLEDLGYFCVDNLPVGLVETTLQHLEEREKPFDKVALGLDVRGGIRDLDRLPALLDRLSGERAQAKIFFLTADDPTLIKRYSETRRRHPLDSGHLGIARAIAEERRLLEPLRAAAGFHFDTSSLSIHQLRREICDGLGAGDQPLILLLESFAFKRGVPPDVDIAFDARCLPNPHWEPDLRPLTGREQGVQDYLGSQEIVQEYVADICRWIDRWLPEYRSTPRNYVTVGVGCTGGKHRSVYVVERVAAHFSPLRDDVLTFHRELL
ncbi:MAG: RNase adapter RapZ [Pseudomonadota bacterium]